MCFDRFLLAFESRDLSQADKSIIRVSSFPSLVIRGRTFFSVSQQLMLKFSAKTRPTIFCPYLKQTGSRMTALVKLTFESCCNIHFHIISFKTKEI